MSGSWTSEDRASRANCAHSSTLRSADCGANGIEFKKVKFRMNQSYGVACRALTALFVSGAVISAAFGDGYLSYTSGRSVNGHPNLTITTRTTGSTATNMWAMAYIEPVNDFNNGYQLDLDYFYSGAGGAFTHYQLGHVLEGSDATNVGNPDAASPIPIAQGGRIVTDTNSTATPPITSQRQALSTNMYVLWMEKNGATSQLMCSFVHDGVQETTPGQNQTTIYVAHPLVTGLVQGATSFGASALPDGTGFVTVTVKSGKTAATITYFKWNSAADTYSLTQAFQQDVSLPGGLPAAYNGNIVCAVTRNFDRMARWYPYRLTLAVDPSAFNFSVQTRDYRLNDKMVSTFYPRYFLTVVPKDNAWHTVGNAANNTNHVTNLITAADGRLMLAVGENSGMTLYSRTGFDAGTQQAVWQAPGQGELLFPYTDNLPSLIYRPIFPGVPPADNTDVKFPVVRDMIVKNDLGVAGVDPTYLVSYEKSTSEQAHRLPLAPTAGSVATVLGIVDGPPPIPNENFLVALPSDPRPWDFAKSDIAFNWTRTASVATESEYTSSLSVDIEATAGVEVGGFSADVELSGEIAWTHGNSFSRKTGDTVEQFAKFANSTTTDANGRVIVTPLGSLYCAYQTFRGYSYEFLDASNNHIPGAQVYTQVWPDGPPTIQVLDYWMNPNGRQPGHLESYVVDAASRSALVALNTVDFSGASTASDPAGGGGDHLYFGYTDSNTVGDTWDHFVSDESKTSEGIKIGEAIKVSASYDFDVVKVGGSVKVAHDSETTRSRTTSHDTSTGIVSECNVTTDRGVPNTYYHESFETFLLRDDNHYLQELLSDDPNGIGLVTPAWPPIGSTMRQDNEAIKAQLIRTSAPWKVTYILSDTPLKTHSLTLGTVTPVVPALDPKLVSKLRNYGVTTTGLADLLIQKKEQLTGSSPRIVTNRPWFEVTRAIEQKAQRLDASIRRYFPDSRTFNAALKSLTDADVAALRQYQAGCDARDQQSFLASHPVRYPAYTPPSIMAKPAIRNVGARFTEIPPAGQ